jgi:signal transduction histidine kinase
VGLVRSDHGVSTTHRAITRHRTATGLDGSAQPTSGLTLLPFAAIALIGQLIAFPNPSSLAQGFFWSSTSLLAVVLVGFSAAHVRRSAVASLTLLLAYIASVALLMMAEGGAATGSGTLFMLPVIVAALFYGYREAACVTVAALLALLAIGLAIHSADGELARRLILWSAICALIVVPIRALRTNLQRSLLEARRLLHRSRTLDAAARELSMLTSEHDVERSAARLAANVASASDAQTWRGAYVRRIDGEVVVDAVFPDDRSASPWIPVDVDVEGLLASVEASGGPVVAAIEQPPRGVDSSPHASGEQQTAWIVIAPEGSCHGFLSIASDAPVTTECLEQLAALAQLVELSLSNLFAHKRLEDQAAAEERRRIARDLHDGLAHELTFIASRSRSRANGSDDAETSEIARSADRALDEARRAITVLSADRRQGIAESISQTAEDLAARHGIAVRLEVADTVEVPGDVGEHLLRITREAICNAATHGRPGAIRVRLWNDGMTHLAVDDDGSGFDVGATSRGFGLVSMRERAERVGGTLCVRSAPGSGTSVEVLLP